MLTDMCVFRLPLILTVLAVTVWMVTLPANGSPCTDNSHNCQADSQRCVERNNSAGFTCQCVQPDQQLDDLNNCTDIPDSQRLYLATPVNTAGVDVAQMFEILRNRAYYERALRLMYQTFNLSSYKDVKLIGYRVGTVPNFGIALYNLLFTEDINAEIIETVARSVLLVEKMGTVSTNNVTVAIAGYTGIFLTEEDMSGDADAVDWCSSPSLYSCRENSTCHDFGLRYDCPCDAGFVDDGYSCYGAVIKGSSPFDTDGSRDLHLYCVASNETEVTEYTWSDVCLQKAGSRCTIRPQPPWDDGKNVTCTVMYRNGQSVAATFGINLNYPPPSSPVIEGYVTGLAIRAGEMLEMTCSVHGGKPLVTSVTFSCPRHPDRTPDVISDSDVTSVLELKLMSSDDGALCRCSALWKTRSWYPQSSTRVLVVKGTADAKGAVDTLDIKLYAIFGVLGLLAVIMVIVVVVICRRRAPSTQDGGGSPSTDMSSAGTTVTSMGTVSTGMKPPEPHGIRLSPLGGENAGRLNWNPLPEPRPNDWSVRPELALANMDTNGIAMDSVGAESGTYHTIPDHVTEGGHGLDLYLHPVRPSRPTPAVPADTYKADQETQTSVPELVSTAL